MLGGVSGSSGRAGGSGGGETGSILSVLVGAGGGESGTGVGCVGGVVGDGLDDSVMVRLARGESRSSLLHSQSCRSSASLSLLLVLFAGGDAISGDALEGGVWVRGDAVGAAMFSEPEHPVLQLQLYRALDGGDGGGAFQLRRRSWLVLVCCMSQ